MKATLSGKWSVTIRVLCGVWALVGLLTSTVPAAGQDLLTFPAVTVPALTVGDVTADEVTNRDNLKTFVQAGAAAYKNAIDQVGFARNDEVVKAFRVDDGVWREGDIYLFITTLEADMVFHGADMDLEGQNLWNLEDKDGVLIAQELVAAAKAGGGYVNYYFDNPDVSGDEPDGSPKVGYAEIVTADGMQLMIGSGFYPVPELAAADVTADQVTDRENLKAFVNGAANAYMAATDAVGFKRSDEVTEPFRVDDGIWREGDIYLFILKPNGKMVFHGNNMSLEGLDRWNIKDKNGVLIVQKLIAAAQRGGGYVEYYYDNPAVEGDETDGSPKVSYAQTVIAGGTEVVIGAGFYPVPELAAADVTADQVTDRENLKAFVNGAADAYMAATDAVGFARTDEVTEPFRVDDGIWREGDIYLFIIKPDGHAVFHGANMSLEGQNLWDLDDKNGVLIVQKLIAAAQRGGDYVEYYFDNPDVSGDETDGSPKVGYAQTVIAGGTEVVIGAGFYPDLTGYMPQVTLAANPATVAEDGSAQTLTVTATQTGRAIPFSTMIQLALSGTATSDDYSVSGDLSITIPGEATQGSTQLTVTALRDDVYESGGETIVVTASHEGQHLGSATVTVSDAYDAPSVVGSPPPITLDAGESETVNAGALFSGNSLSYTASSSDVGVATAVVTAATVTVTGVRKGTATVTLTASNAAGEASSVMRVNVTAVAAEREVYENILAAMGRNMLVSVSTTIGERFSTAGGRHELALGGRSINGLTSGISALVGLTGHRPQATSKHMELLQDGGQRRSATSGYLLRTSSFSYPLEDQTAGGGLRWSVWGAGDWQNFEGEPNVDARYDGDLKTAYAGFDVAAQQNWMGGIALSYAMGQSDYDVTVADGTLKSTLASVLPYARWTSICGRAEAWSILGLGTGEVEVEDATGDLAMRMAMLGMRLQLAAAGRVGIDVIGDAGLLRLSTSESESASLSDITGDVQRLRVGLKGSHRTKLASGATITPYAQVAGRYDGGTGQTGQGLEISGGLKVGAGRVGIKAQGRFLAMHTADGYRENGVALVAYLNSGAGGQGLSMSVSPRMGAEANDSGTMWRDNPLTDASNHRNSGRNAVRTAVGYGLTFPSKGLVMTPFGEMYLTGDARQLMRLGTRLGTAHRDSGAVSVELSGTRVGRQDGDLRIALIGRMSF